MQETWVLSWVRKIPWRRKWQPTLVSLPRKSHGQRSLTGYSPWCHRESDTTEMTYTQATTIIQWLYLILWSHSVQFSHSAVYDSLRPHGWQHARPPCPSPTPGVYSNSCPLSRWCHPTISSSVVPFSSRLQSFPSSASFPVSQFFPSIAKVLEFQLQHQSFQ